MDQALVELSHLPQGPARDHLFALVDSLKRRRLDTVR